MDEVRQNAHAAARDSVDPELWRQNGGFLQTLAAEMTRHRAFRHPACRRGGLNPEAARRFYLDYGQIMEAVTRAVLQALCASATLQARLGPQAVYAARFLLQLNLLDELGLRVEQNGLAGHPGNSHFWQYAQAIAPLGVDIPALMSHAPPPTGRAVIRIFEETDYVRLVAALAVFDKLFSEVLADWTVAVARASGLNIDRGYFSIGMDVEAAGDSWILARQALEPECYPEIRQAAITSLDAWAVWLDEL